MATRFILTRCLALALAAGFTAGAAKAEALHLKTDIVVDGEFVRWADMLDIKGEAGETPIFRAPDLGATGTIQVSRVQEAAREHHLGEIDTGGFSTLVIRRSGRLVSLEEIRSAVREALIERQALSPDARLGFDPGMRPIVVESTARGSAVAGEVNLNQRSGRFDVVVRVPGSAITERMPLRISGSVGDVAVVPVLVRSMSKGDIVQASDLGTQQVKRADLASDTVFETTRLSGMQLRNNAPKGQILREADLSRPELVERGGMVTLVYENRGITLTVKGKAMSSGAQGDVVSVQNLGSKKVIEGRVTGPGRVSVQPIGAPFNTASIGEAP